MTAPDYGKAFGLWRTHSGNAWSAYVRHPFVESLGDGSLPHRAFLNYLKQDYLFLVNFARAWALAVVKSRDMREMRAAAAAVDGLVNREMALHVETCAAAGIPEDDLLSLREAPQNLAYTRFVLEKGYSGDYLDLMAALAPCGMGYGEIGRRLAREATSSVYREWIDTYGNEAYQDGCRESGALTDAALENRLGPHYAESPRWKELCHVFEMANPSRGGVLGDRLGRLRLRRRRSLQAGLSEVPPSRICRKVSGPTDP